MKLAASVALAELAKEEVPDAVLRAYGNEKFTFGRLYLIPKPFDSRVLLNVPVAVARAAAETGVAQEPITDYDAYRRRLEQLLGRARGMMHGVYDRRSEEHTSELQSHLNLVCRLLLEKKNKIASYGL